MPLNTVQANFVSGLTELGSGQVWTDMLASRAFGTTYTNTTGRPIQVNILTFHSAAGGSILEVGGVRVAHEGASIGGAANNNLSAVLSAVVPNNTTYRVTTLPTYTNATIQFWAELR